jgi:uncharacterized iron-regulated membrane protein
MRSETLVGHAPRTASALYRTLWRWHFYAGLACVPILLSLSITGGIYLFKPDVDRAQHAPYLNLTPGPVRASADAHIAAALAALPNARFIDYRVPDTATAAPVITVNADGVRHAITVDPWRLSILNVRDLDAAAMETVRNLHGELLGGDIGSLLVELAGSWAIVLIVTGLYLGWPPDARGPAGVLWPRGARSGRARWREWHAVIGFWVSLLVLFLLVSGLPWSQVWGGAFKEALAWVGQFGEPAWTGGRSDEVRVWQRRALAEVHLPDAVVERAAALAFAPPATLAPQPGAPGIWSLASDHPNRMLRETARIEGASGKVLSQKAFKDQPLLDRAIGIGISAHEGALFGRVNQVLGMVAALGTLALAVSGVVLWLRRKPADALGAPPAPPSAGRRAFPALVLGLACVLPLLAASLVALWLIEQGLRRIPPAARWLGLAH